MVKKPEIFIPSTSSNEGLKAENLQRRLSQKNILKKAQNKKIPVDDNQRDLYDIEKKLSEIFIEKEISLSITERMLIERLVSNGIDLQKSRDIAKIIADYSEEIAKRKALSPGLDKFNFNTKKIKPNEIRTDSTSKLPKMPDHAPVEWNPKDKSQGNVIEFIYKHYGTWLGHGLTTGYLSEIDRKLYDAYRYYKTHNPLPPGFEIPSKYEQLRQEVPEVPTEDEVRHARKVLGMWTRYVAKQGNQTDIEK